MRKKLAELQQRKAALVKDGRALLDSAEAAGAWSEDFSAKVKANQQEIEAINAKIDAMQAQIDAEASLDSDGATAAQAVSVRDLEAERPFACLGEQLQAIAAASRPGGGVDKRLLRINAAAGTGSNEGLGSEGAYLVQTDIARDLSTMDADSNVLLSRCAQRTISTEANSVEIVGIDETSRANGSRNGGVRVYTKAELAQYDSSRPNFNTFKIEMEKLTGLSFASDEILKDAAFLGQEVAGLFREEFAFKVQDLLVNGSGAGEPLGVLAAAALVSQAKETGQSAATILFENIVKMWARMPARHRANAIWVINQDVEPQLMTMTMAVGTGGVPVYLPANGLAGQPYGTLFGRPVIPIEQCPTLGTVGDIMLVDMSQYVFITKGTIEEAMSIHLKFDYGQTTFRWTWRVGGQPRWRSALTPYKGSNTLSPFVALATRA